MMTIISLKHLIPLTWLRITRYRSMLLSKGANYVQGSHGKTFPPQSQVNILETLTTVVSSAGDGDGGLRRGDR